MMADTNQSLDRYQIREKIGAGGMGTVYHAWDRDIERDVALKWLPESFSADPNFVERFRREARFIARLEHPHIVPIYDVGQYQGRPFIIMRLLSGGTLRDRLARPDFGLVTLMPVMNQIADALMAAHSQHIVHRDIKPGNILFDDRGVAFLSDFGVAKLLDAATMLTGSGVVGTPAYMSPEQFIGQEIDGRTDQYALAVVFYEALSGQLPFDGNTVQMMYKHLNTEASEIDLAKLPALVGLNQVLKKALAKNPNDRYPTVQEFVADAREITDAIARSQRVLLPLAAPVYRPPSAFVTPAGVVIPPSRGTPPPTSPAPATAVDIPSDRLQPVSPPRMPAPTPQSSSATPLSAGGAAFAAARAVPAADPRTAVDRTIVEPLSAPPVTPPRTGMPSSAATPPATTPPATTPPAAVPLPAPTPAPVAATKRVAPAAAAESRGLPGWMRAAAGVVVLLLVIVAGWWLFSGIGGNTEGGDVTPEPPTQVSVILAAADLTATAALGPESTALAPPTEAPASPTNTLEATAVGAGVLPVVLVRVVVDAADLHEGPGVAYPVIGRVERGDQLEVIARTADDSWYNIVIASGARAWIAKSAVTPIDKEAITTVPVAATVPAPPPTIAATDEPTATVAPTLPPTTIPPTQPPATAPPTNPPPTNPPPTQPPPTQPPPTQPPPTDPPPPPSYTPEPPAPPPTDPPPPPPTYTEEPP